MAAPHSRDAVTVGRSRSVSFPPLAVVLAVAAGAMDGTCFTRLGQVFAGLKTGNLTLLGLAAANRSAGLAGHIALALGGYLTGAAVGSVIAQRSAHEDTTRRRPVLLVLLTELAVLAGFTAGWVLTGGHPAGAAQLGLLAVATVATGLQAAAVHSVGEAVDDLPDRHDDRSRRRPGHRRAVTVRRPLEPRRPCRPRSRSRSRRRLLLVAPTTLPLLPDVALLVVLSILSANDAAPRP
jgi:hypothetical protein